MVGNAGSLPAAGVRLPVWGFIGIWALFNFLQAAFLPLDPDEAYYWEYARDLDWGYFDHPPAIALLVGLGSWLIDGPLGVRLGVVLLHIGTLWLFWQWVSDKRSLDLAPAWMAVAAGLPFIHVYGFTATPDSPLLFFSIAYLCLLDRFKKGPGMGIALLWGAVMAALLYSKYHGILVIGFTVAANLRLFRNPYFWVAGISGAVLFFPHLWWQYAHDFPSFRYHLSGRDDPYQVKYTVEYFINQAVVFSPLMFPFFLRAFALFRQQTTSGWLVLGFWAFFFYTTFKGHVEPQWTAVLSFPLAMMGLYYGAGRPGFLRQLTRMGWVSAGIILCVRIFLLFPLEGVKMPFVKKYWPEKLSKIAGDYPVVFHNSYRDVSEYEFYTRKPAYAFTNVYYRPSQFDVWSGEEAFQNEKFLMVLQPGQDTCRASFMLNLTKKVRPAVSVDTFQVIQKVRLWSDDFPDVLNIGSDYSISLAIENRYPFAIFPAKGSHPVTAHVVFLQEGQVVQHAPLVIENPATSWPQKESLLQKALFRTPSLAPGTYDIILGLSNGDLPPGWNSKAISKVRCTNDEVRFKKQELRGNGKLKD
ncbi:MAG: glycosyltransferase family 39 protein [Haliscomenobacter sp.]|nr:glycosyltransferase family 39 protein [Haliscomenobacter sp.]